MKTKNIIQKIYSWNITLWGTRHRLQNQICRKCDVEMKFQQDLQSTNNKLILYRKLPTLIQRKTKLMTSYRLWVVKLCILRLYIQRCFCVLIPCWHQKEKWSLQYIMYSIYNKIRSLITLKGKPQILTSKTKNKMIDLSAEQINHLNWISTTPDVRILA